MRAGWNRLVQQGLTDKARLSQTFPRELLSSLFFTLANDLFSQRVDFASNRADGRLVDSWSSVNSSCTFPGLKNTLHFLKFH